MAGKTKVRRSGMFLLELMIAILFFSVAGAVCTQVFVKAHDLSAQAQSLSRGVSVCSDAAEIVRAGEDPEEIERLLREAWRFREEGDTLSADLESGTLTVTPGREGDLYTADIAYLEDGETVYTLALRRSLPEVRE